LKGKIFIYSEKCKKFIFVDYKTLLVYTNLMTLLNIKNNTWVRIIGFRGGWGMQQHFMQVGFLPGNTARIVRSAPFHGPLLVEVDGREIVIGRKIARHILVENLA
jgi:ferrous iron transport protein A